jgi:mycothiol synthase
MTGIAETTTSTVWLELPDAPPVPGLRFRAFRDLADYEPMSQVLCAGARADDIPWLPTADHLRIENEGDDGISPPDDIVFAEIDGVVVAVAGSDRVIRDDVPTYEIWGSIDPVARRRGIGTALFARNLARVHERAATVDPGLPVVISTGAEDGQEGDRILAETNGFEPVRTFYLMRRDLSAPIPDAPLPDGIELRTVTPDQHRTIYDAQVEAFRDHWGHREGSEHGFEATYARKELDTSLWAVAWAGDEVAGVVENWIWADENAQLGVERGWLEKVSVRRPFRRKGLARALVAESLRRFRDAGMTDGMLGVDATNPLGALPLYEGVGFEVARRERAYRRTDEPRPAGEATTEATT